MARTQNTIATMDDMGSLVTASASQTGYKVFGEKEYSVLIPITYEEYNRLVVVAIGTADKIQSDRHPFPANVQHFYLERKTVYQHSSEALLYTSAFLGLPLSVDVEGNSCVGDDEDKVVPNRQGNSLVVRKLATWNYMTFQEQPETTTTRKQCNQMTIVVNIKRQLKQRKHLILIKNDLYPVRYTDSMEYVIANPREIFSFVAKLKEQFVIERQCYFYRVPPCDEDSNFNVNGTDKTLECRISVEKKYNIETGTTRYFIHLETESCSLSQLQELITNHDILGFRNTLHISPQQPCWANCLTFNRTYDYIDCVDVLNLIQSLNLRRKFIEMILGPSHKLQWPKKCSFYSLKFDGTRTLTILSPTMLFFVSGELCGSVPHNFNLNFYYVGFSEYLPDTNIIVLIDILARIYIDSYQDLQINLCSNFDAIHFINNLPALPSSDNGSQIARISKSTLCRMDNNTPVTVHKTTFIMGDRRELIPLSRLWDAPFDGELHYMENKIYKIKFISSIDLRVDIYAWFELLATNGIISKRECRQNYKNNPITVNDLQKYDEHLPLLINLLQCYDTAVGQLVNIQKYLDQYRFQWTPNINDWRIYQPNNSNAIESTSLIHSFLIIEFNIFPAEKLLVFKTIRHKPNSNTLQYILPLLSSTP